jgi:acetoin utilization protein AcuB
MFVRDWMTPDPVTVDDSDPIGKCREMLGIHKVRRLPVLRDGNVTGIITDRDLRGAEASQLVSGDHEAAQAESDSAKVGLICKEQLMSVQPDDTIEHAAAIMYTQRISGLPVLEDGTLVGIITETDVFRAFVEVLGFQEQTSRLVLSLADDEPPLWRQLKELEAKGLTATSVVTYRRRAGGDAQAVVRATGAPSAGGDA